MNYLQYAKDGVKTDVQKINTPWPLFSGHRQSSDTTRIKGATYIDEVYVDEDGTIKNVSKALYPDGSRDLDVTETKDGNSVQQIKGWRPNGTLIYEINTPLKVPKGKGGLELVRKWNKFNPLTQRSRIASWFPKDAHNNVEFPAVVVDKKTQTLRHYDEDGNQQLRGTLNTDEF